MKSLNSLTLAAALFVLTPLTAQANLILNGGFEDGDFSNWTLNGSAADNFVAAGGTANSGQFNAYFAELGSLAFLSQSFAASAGSLLTISYFLQSDGSTPNEFQVLLNNTLIFDQFNIPFGGYIQGSFNAIATGFDTLTFGARNDPGFLQLDDVSVTAVAAAVPEPASLLLLGAGLLAAFGFRRRIKI